MRTTDHTYMRTKRNGRPCRVRRGNSLSLGTVPVQGCHFYWTAHTSPPDVDFLIRLVHCAVKHCVCCLGYGAMWIGSEYQRFVGACCFLLQGGQSGMFVCMYTHTHTHTPVHMVSYARLLNFYYVGLDLRGFWFQSRSGIDVCLLLNGGRSCAVV